MRAQGKTRKQEELWRQNRPAPPQTQIPPLKNRGSPRHSSLPCASAQEPWESPLAPESSTVLQWGFLSRGRVPIHPPCPAEQHHPHLQERRAQPSSPAGLGEPQLQVGGGGDYSEGSPGSAVWSPCVQSNPQTGTHVASAALRTIFLLWRKRGRTAKIFKKYMTCRLRHAALSPSMLG